MENQSGKGGARPKILIVDDIPKNIQVCAHMLKDLNCEIAAATSGAQALALASGFKPDLILLDVMMPDMDGFQVCECLKKSDSCDIPVIFLTARVETEDVLRGFAAGAADYVTKPFNPAELAARSRTQLSLKAARDSERKLVADLKRALELNRQMHISFFDLIRLLKDVIAEVCPKLATHSQNIADLAGHVARELGVSAEARQNVVAAALLHCVGLIGASEETYLKLPSQLSGEPREIYTRAPEAAADLFRSIPQLKHICEIILTHRENMDGTGPMGLPGDKLSIEARILRVCEFYDSSAWLRGEHTDDVVGVMNKKTGAWFDKDCLRAFIVVLSRKSGILTVPVQDLRPGMKLARNLMSNSGHVLISAGAAISGLNLKRIKMYHEQNPMEDAYVFVE